MIKNQQVILDNRPKTEASTSNFRFFTAEIPPLQAGQVLVQHHYLSIDPYMRDRMNNVKSYAQPQTLGEVMIGSTAGEVIESRHPSYVPGDMVVGMGGWQEYSVIAADQPGLLQKVDTSLIPLSHYLGALGMPGVTAWYGLSKIINPKPGETVVVSAASGAVGSAVGVLAKARGARAVGIAGGSEKCRYVVEELGFDACIDYKAYPDIVSLSKSLKNTCPQGIDGYFENVGGQILDAVMLRMNPFGRIAMCGMIAGYEGQPIPMVYPQLLLVNRLLIEGFIISEHMEIWPAALEELGQLLGSGKLRPRESISQGLESAPGALLSLLKGKNFGKQLVKLI
jgi:NADPH-dependent curcumin reductase CurA